MNQFHNYEDFGVGDSLLSVLQEGGVVTESFVRLTQVQSQMLEESSTSGRVVTVKGRQINLDVFKRIYTDYDNYEEPEDVIRGLGIDPDEFTPRDRLDQDEARVVRRRTIQRTLKRITDKFREEKLYNFVSVKDRKRAYSSRFAPDPSQSVDEFEFKKPTFDDIDFGSNARSNTRTSSVVKKINNEDLISGEFYNNRTRIPKSRWSPWVKFWDRKLRSVAPDKSIIGREWKKTFLLGYQMEPNVYYEIWYNSIDSTFGVHDARGSEITRRYETMNEALKGLFNHVAQISPNDREFFGRMNNKLAMSLSRSLVSTTDQHMKSMLKREERDAKKRKQEFEQKKKESKTAAMDFDRTKVKDPKPSNWDEVKGFDSSSTNAKFGSDLRGSQSEQEKEQERQRQAFAKRAEVARIERQAKAIQGIVKDQLAKAEDEAERERIRANAEDVLTRIQTGDLGFDDLLGADLSKFVAGKDWDDSTSKTPKAKQPPKKKGKAKLTPDERKAALRKAVKGLENESRALAVNESTEEGQEIAGDIDDAIGVTVKSNSHKAVVKDLRTNALSGRNTTQGLKDAISNDVIETYTKTKAETSWFKRQMNNSVFSGRRLPFVSPFDFSGSESVKGFIRNAFTGAGYHADFVIGFSVGDSRANFEIWYVTEPNPDYEWSVRDIFSVRGNVPRTISSFYVFDVDGGHLIRKYIPYYRNAIQTVMTKIGTF